MRPAALQARRSGTMSAVVAAPRTRTVAVSAQRAVLPQADAAAGATGVAAAPKPSMLSRLLGLVPLGTGVAQAVVGFMITRGTLAIAGLPLIGALPGWLVGGLVAATAMGSIIGGVQRLLGRA